MIERRETVLGVRWFKNGKFHSEVIPAVKDDGYFAWYINGRHHNVSGVECVWVGGFQRWPVWGVAIK